MTDSGPSPAFLELADRSSTALRAAMRRGDRPDPTSLEGWEFRGLNTARWMRLAGADRFVKGFAPGRGYNRRVERGHRTEPWLPHGGEARAPWAPFAVTPVDAEAVDNRYLQALLLDYGAVARGPLDPAGRIRDYLVTVHEANGLLLGHAFVALGRTRLHATFFVLEPLRPAPAR